MSLEDGCNNFWDDSWKFTSLLWTNKICIYFIYIIYFSLVNKIYICIYFFLFLFLLSAFLSSSPKSLFPLLLLVPMHVIVLDLCEACLLNRFTSLIFLDQDTSREYSYPDVGRHTPQSRRQTHDVKEVGKMHHCNMFLLNFSSIINILSKLWSNCK